MRKAVIFDLDGVITDTARYHFLAWKRLANEIGLDIDEKFNEKLKGVDRMKSLELILAQGQKVYSEPEKERLAQKKNDYFKGLLEGITEKDLLPGAARLLKEVRERKLKVALASVSKNASTVLAKLGITSQFDYIVDANKITRTKPDPEIFLNAAEGLGVSPIECIGVEDAAVGIEAIKAANMYAIGVGDPKILSAADLVIPDLTAFHLDQVLKAA
jgi:beta-phosphoglucomutase